MKMHSVIARYMVVVLAATLAVALPSDINDIKSNKLAIKTEWLSREQLKSIPSIEEISWQGLQDMPLDRGARIMEIIYHLLQINRNILPSFIPQAIDIPVYFIATNGQKIITNLIEMISIAKQMPRFAEQQLTIYITGYPEISKTIKDANDKLIENYIQRFRIQNQEFEKSQTFSIKYEPISIEEHNNDRDWKILKSIKGDLIVIDLGAVLMNFKDFAMLDITRTGSMIGIALIDLIKQIQIPQQMIHIVAQGIGAHIAGAAANQIARNTGQKIHRITALDPSKIFTKDSNELIGLSHGDAEFIDAIHSSPYAIGIPNRIADVDFYTDGAIIDTINAITANNIIEAAMSATNIFAESLIPGREHNFPAINAKSMNDYKINNIYSRRAFIGINTDHDLKGTYISEINSKAPIAIRSPITNHKFILRNSQ